MSKPSTRRHDLDALRVICFGILIFYHVSMLYVPWDFHIKSRHAPLLALTEPMRLTNLWRLALLFFISGVATRFALEKYTPGQFARRRGVQLGLPILFGMLVIVPPQTFFELRQAEVIEPNYWNFMLGYLSNSFNLFTPTWNHLWYVVYLLVYSLLIAGFRGFSQAFHLSIKNPFESIYPLILTATIPIPFIGYVLFLEPHFPTTYNLVWDWANHAHRFTIFLVGYLVAKSTPFWEFNCRFSFYSLLLTVILGTMLVTLRNAPLSSFVWTLLNVYYAWGVIFSFLGLGQRYLSKPSKAGTYLNTAVFTYYIVHQTITIVFGYYVTQFPLSAELELFLVALATAVGSALIYEVIRRIRFLRPFMGLAYR